MYRRVVRWRDFVHGDGQWRAMVRPYEQIAFVRLEDGFQPDEKYADRVVHELLRSTEAACGRCNMTLVYEHNAFMGPMMADVARMAGENGFLVQTVELVLCDVRDPIAEGRAHLVKLHESIGADVCVLFPLYPFNAFRICSNVLGQLLGVGVQVNERVWSQLLTCYPARVESTHMVLV